MCQTSTGQIVWQVVRRDGDQVARCGAEAMVTRDFMGPLGGFWSKLGRKRVTGWKHNIHVSLCTNYAVWKWMLKIKHTNNKP
jgi:hypothetical protein